MSARSAGPTSRRNVVTSAGEHVVNEDVGDVRFVAAAGGASTEYLDSFIAGGRLRLVGAFRAGRHDRVVVVGDRDHVDLARPPAGGAIALVVVAVTPRDCRDERVVELLVTAVTQ